MLPLSSVKLGEQECAGLAGFSGWVFGVVMVMVWLVECSVVVVSERWWVLWWSLVVVAYSVSVSLSVVVVEDTFVLPLVCVDSHFNAVNADELIHILEELVDDVAHVGLADFFFQNECGVDHSVWVVNIDASYVAVCGVYDEE